MIDTTTLQIFVEKSKFLNKGAEFIRKLFLEHNNAYFEYFA